MLIQPFCVGCLLFLFLLENQVDNYQEDECANSTDNNSVEPFPIASENLKADVKHVEKPAAKETADNTDKEIHDEPHAFSFEKQAAQPAGQCADYNESDDFGR